MRELLHQWRVVGVAALSTLEVVLGWRRGPWPLRLAPRRFGMRAPSMTTESKQAVPKRAGRRVLPGNHTPPAATHSLLTPKLETNSADLVCRSLVSWIACWAAFGPAVLIHHPPCCVVFTAYHDRYFFVYLPFIQRLAQHAFWDRIRPQSSWRAWVPDVACASRGECHGSRRWQMVGLDTSRTGSELSPAPSAPHLDTRTCDTSTRPTTAPRAAPCHTAVSARPASHRTAHPPPPPLRVLAVGRPEPSSAVKHSHSARRSAHDRAISQCGRQRSEQHVGRYPERVRRSGDAVYEAAMHR